MKTFEPREWQKVVITGIDQYEDYACTEDMISISEYEKNKASAIAVSYPRGFGHTSLATYIGSKYPSLILVFGFEHYEDSLKKRMEEFGLRLHEDSHIMSVYEVIYALLSVAPDGIMPDIEKIKDKFRDRVIVVDEAVKLPNRVKDFIYAISTKAIILLG